LRRKAKTSPLIVSNERWLVGSQERKRVPFQGEIPVNKLSSCLTNRAENSGEMIYNNLRYLNLSFRGMRLADGEKRKNNTMQYYIHYVPGRIRIQTPKLHENAGNAAQFEKFMKAIKGVTAVETHVVTGSAIIHFNEKTINCEQVIGILEKEAYFCLAHAETCDEVIEKTTERVLGVAEKIIVDSLGGESGE